MSPLSTEKESLEGISHADVKKFQDIYEHEFGVRLTEEHAREKGERLLTLMRTVYQQCRRLEKEAARAYSEDNA